MGLGDSVSALLETYSNCLKLLKAFNHPKKEGGRSGDDQLLLRKSIKSDRATVRRAYSSRRSEVGSRFEKGDRPARSALRRVLKRLTAAISNILNFSKGQGPVLDYESLMSLSNASRIDTIAAFDQLSNRLRRNSSRSSVVSTTTASSKHKRRRSSSSNSDTTASTSSRGQTQQSSSTKLSKASKHQDAPSRHGSRMAMPKKGEPSSSHPPSTRRESRDSPSGSGSSTAVANRVSLMSISTDSTQLGEIPTRKLRRRHEYDAALDEYNVSPIYPLNRYPAPEFKERSFWGFFRR